jgi:hypothetical protein
MGYEPLISVVNPYDAKKIIVRPNDVGALGSYAFLATTGTMAAGLAADSPIFSFRWGTNLGPLALIKEVRIAVNSLTGFTAGIGKLQLFIARSFSASDSGGAAITLTNNQAKKRASFGSSLVTDVRISTTATLTAGTRTKDTLPFAGLHFAVPTTANFVMLPTAGLWLPNHGGEWPIVLGQNEGIVIQATVPATGTWNGLIQIVWDEIGAY